MSLLRALMFCKASLWMRIYHLTSRLKIKEGVAGIRRVWIDLRLKKTVCNCHQVEDRVTLRSLTRGFPTRMICKCQRIRLRIISSMLLTARIEAPTGAAKGLWSPPCDRRPHQIYHQPISFRKLATLFQLWKRRAKKVSNSKKINLSRRLSSASALRASMMETRTAWKAAVQREASSNPCTLKMHSNLRSP